MFFLLFYTRDIS